MRNKLYMYFVATITFVAIVGGNYLANKVNVQAEIADPEVKGVQYDSGDNNFVKNAIINESIRYEQEKAELEELEELRVIEESKIQEELLAVQAVDEVEVVNTAIVEDGVASEVVEEPVIETKEVVNTSVVAVEGVEIVEPVVCDESTQWYSEDYSYCIDKPSVLEPVVTPAIEATVETVPPVVTPVSEPVPPAEPVYYNSITMPSVGIGIVPVVYASINDFFEGGDYSKPLDTDSPGTPVQNLMRQGVTHIPFSGAPGAVGNSYLVGHSSSPYGSGSSYIDSVFENLMYRGAVGDEFYFHDSSGKKLTYRIFEAREISAYDVSTAYAPMGGRKVMTIQTCTYTNDLMWIVRGELVE